MSAPTSRRTILCGASLSVAAVAVSAMAATPPSTVDGVSPQLATLIGEAIAANAMVDQHQRLVVDSAVGLPAIRAANADNNILNDAYVDALDVVAFHPVSTIADLRAKLAFMLKNRMGEGDEDWLEPINADVLRIAAAGGR